MNLLDTAVSSNSDWFRKHLPQHTKVYLLQLSKRFFAIGYHVVGKIESIPKQEAVNSLLCYYILTGNATAVKMVLENGIRPDSTTLSLAIKIRHEDIAWLIHKSLSLSSSASLLLPPSHSLSSTNQPTSSSSSSSPSPPPSLPESPFVHALRQGYMELARKIRQDNEKLPLGTFSSILLLLGETQSIEAFISNLIDMGADVNEEEGRPLRTAVLLNDIEMLRALIKKGADINRIHPQSGPLIFYAVLYGNREMVKEFINNGADVGCEWEGKTLLNKALDTKKYQFEIIKVLLDSNPNIERCLSLAQSSQMKYKLYILANDNSCFDELEKVYGPLFVLADISPLHWAAFPGHTELVEQMLYQFGNDVRKKTRKNSITPLHMAVLGGHTHVVCLLNDLAYINCSAVDYGTPFHLAVTLGNKEMMTALKTIGACIDMHIDPLGTPMHIAVEKGDIELVKHLKHLGYPGFPTDILRIPAIEGDIEIARAIIDLGINVNCQVQYWGGVSTTVGAGRQTKSDKHSVRKVGGYAKVLVELVKSGLDMKAYGAEMMVEAVTHGDEELVREIVRQYPEIVTMSNQSSVVGGKKMVSPIFCGSAKMKKTLVSLGFDPNVRNQNGATPLHCLIDSEYPLTASEIYSFARLCNVNAADSKGKTPLHYAAWICRADIARMLVLLGANVNAEDPNGKRPLQNVNIYSPYAGSMLETLREMGGKRDVL